LEGSSFGEHGLPEFLLRDENEHVPLDDVGHTRKKNVESKGSDQIPLKQKKKRHHTRLWWGLKKVKQLGWRRLRVEGKKPSRS